MGPLRTIAKARIASKASTNKSKQKAQAIERFLSWRVKNRAIPIGINHFEAAASVSLFIKKHQRYTAQGPVRKARTLECPGAWAAEAPILLGPTHALALGAFQRRT